MLYFRKSPEYHGRRSVQLPIQSPSHPSEPFVDPKYHWHLMSISKYEPRVYIMWHDALLLLGALLCLEGLFTHCFLSGNLLSIARHGIYDQKATSSW